MRGRSDGEGRGTKAGQGPSTWQRWRSRDTCEWFFSGGRCRAASRSGPARAREHGMSLGGWDGASQCALGRRRRTGWRPTQKASINVARYARLTKGSHVQHVARKAKTSDAAGQQPAVGVAKALLPHRPRWCASRFSRGRAALRCTCTERIQDVISAIICHVRVNADAVKPSPEVWRPARPRGGKL